MRSKFNAVLLPFFASAAIASLSSPFDTQCRGSCQVKRDAHPTEPPNSITIEGPDHLVSDISERSGWQVIGCPRDWSEGAIEVRLVCTDEDSASSCDHLHQGQTENKVVRLPESCGKGPFARLARWSVARDQKLPSGSAAAHQLHARKLSRSVYTARLDYKFRELPQDQGEIKIDIVGAPHTKVRDSITHSSHVAPAIENLEHKRAPSATSFAIPTATADFGLPGFLTSIISSASSIASSVGSDVSSGASSIASDASSVASDASSTLTSVASEASSTLTSVASEASSTLSSVGSEASSDASSVGSVVSSGVSSVGSVVSSGVSSVGSVVSSDVSSVASAAVADLANGIQKSDGLQVINFQKSNLSLLDTQLTCTTNDFGFQSSASISVDADIVLNAGYAFKIKGTLVPFDIADFAVAGAFSGNVDLNFNIDMYLSLDFQTPPIELFNLGLPGLTYPGILTLGPSVSVKAYAEFTVDVAFSMTIPVKADFSRITFAIPSNLTAGGGAYAQTSKDTTNIQFGVSPGEQTGSAAIHVIPALEFGIDILDGHATADAYVSVDLDATLSSNGTIDTDFSYDGCQDLSVGALVTAGVQASAFSYLSAGDFLTLLSIRENLWGHCSNGSSSGPSTVIYSGDDGDNSYTNELGDLVNKFGELIDDAGNIIPDFDAADATPPPIMGANGTALSEDDVTFDNGDGTFENAFGNFTNNLGQQIFNGSLLGCELDTSNMTDANGTALDAADAIFDLGEGFFSDGSCNLVDEAGNLIGLSGSPIDYEPFIDAATNTTIACADALIDNEDGTFEDCWGNAVDQWGGAIDFDDLGNLLGVTLNPADNDIFNATQEAADPEVTNNPDFTLVAPTDLQQIAEGLLKGTAPPPLPSQTPVTSSAPQLSSSGLSSLSTDSSSTATGSTDASSSSTSTDAPSSSADSSSTAAPSSSVDSSSVPASTAASKRFVTKRAHHDVRTPISRALRQKRAVLGRRSGPSCLLPSLSGMPLPAIMDHTQLARLF